MEAFVWKWFHKYSEDMPQSGPCHTYFTFQLALIIVIYINSHMEK